MTNDLDPATADLVRDFANALAAKLARAQKKYGYTDGWATQDWKDECRQHLREHLAKGDPLDVAAYCAFMWRRGWSTVSDDEEQAARALIAEYREIWPGSHPAMPEAKRLARAVLMSR